MAESCQLLDILRFLLVETNIGQWGAGGIAGFVALLFFLRRPPWGKRVE